MRILITGSSGLIGTALTAALTAQGHTVLHAVRKQPLNGQTQIFWNPNAGILDPAHLQGLDAVVNLAGKNLTEGRWTPENKKAYWDSRINGTRLLSEALAGMSAPPKILLSASAVGIYGDRGDEPLTETSAPGTGYLAELCLAWEAATQPAAAHGLRTVFLRTGIVLAPSGGALDKMLPIFKLGLGGHIGNGRQYMSWITLDDEIGGIIHALNNDSISGPINLSAPNPVTNRDFTHALARALRRPAVFPVPAFALRMAFGEMADAALLSSTRALPDKLIASGYSFIYTDLEAALRQIIK